MSIEPVNSRRNATRSAAVVTIVGGTIVVGATPASAATFEVVNGLAGVGDAGSLPWAIDQANSTPGPDTITFGAGAPASIDVGAQSLRVGDDLTIVGPGEASLTLTNTSGDMLYVYNLASLALSGLTIDSASDDAVDFRNFLNGSLTDVTIDNSSSSGIEADGGLSLTLTNVTITNSVSASVDISYIATVTADNVDVYASGNDGFTVDNVDTATFTDVKVESVSSDGFDLYRVKVTTFTNPDLDDVSSEGFTIDESDVIAITDGDLYNVGSEGIEVDDSVSLSIIDTEIADVSQEGLDLSGIDEVTLSNVTIDADGNTNDGIYISEIGDVSMTTVSVSDADDSGVTIRDTDSVVATGVTVTGTFNDDGLYFYDVGSVSLTSTTISDVFDDGLVTKYVDTLSVTDLAVTDADADDESVGSNGLYLRKSGVMSLSDVSIDAADDASIYVKYGDSFSGDLLTITNSGGNAVDIYETGVAAVSNSTITTTAGRGIEAYPDIESLTITNTRIDESTSDGLYTDDVRKLLVDGLTITDSGGAGMELRASGFADDAFVIRNSSVDGSTAFGIGAYDDVESVTIENTTVSDSGQAGLLFKDRIQTVAITEVTLTDSAGDGIDFFDDVRNVSISDTTIDGFGDSGIDGKNASGQVRIGRVTVNNGDAASSAIDLYDNADVKIVNSTIADNAITGSHVIEADETTLEIAHSTISDNAVTGAAPNGVVSATSNSTVDLDHVIATGNGGLSLETDGTSVIASSDSLLPVGAGIAGNVEIADPLLDPLGDNGGPTETMWPAAGSPAIDGGDPAITGEPATDQRGGPRVVGTVDIGSVEVNAGEVNLDAAAVTVDEGAGSLTVTVTRVGSDGAASVDVVTAAGSATAGDDFTAVSETLSWADGEDGPKIVSIPITDDDDVESDETFTVSLTAPVATSVGPVSSTTVTITDNESAVSDAITVLGPQRFADTRPNGETIDDISEKTGKLSPGGEITVQIAGRGGVPADAVGVVMNVTAVAAEGNGFVTAHACVTPRPLASSLNYTAGVNLGNEVIAGLSASGEVCLYSSNSAHLTVDVVGYITASSPLKNVTPARILDTRATGETVDSQDEGGGKTTAGSETTLTVAGRAGVPADAAAVIVNVTAVNATGTGFVTVHPCVSPRPLASSLNHVAGVNRGNELVASLNAAGEMCLFTSASIDLTVDVVGYLPAGTNLKAVTPARLLDSRPGESTVDAQDAGVGKLAAGDEYTLSVTGRAGVPAGAKAAIVNVTAIAAEGVGFVTVHPCADPRPLASSLNYVPGVNGGNEIIASLNGAGELCLFTSAAAHLAVDIVGYLE